MRELDLELVRGLCELHPWEFQRLGEIAGLPKSVVANFLAGRRPLPRRAAATFLKQIGLLTDGQIDTNHCFVFHVRLGMEDLARDWIARLFPNGGRRIDLSNERLNSGRARNDADAIVYGKALFDGRLAAIVQESPELDRDLHLPGSWQLVDFDNSADRLLSSSYAPTKDEVVRMFAESNFVGDASWRNVEEYARSLGMTPTDVLRLLESSKGALLSPGTPAKLTK